MPNDNNKNPKDVTKKSIDISSALIKNGSIIDISEFRELISDKIANFEDAIAGKLELKVEAEPWLVYLVRNDKYEYLEYVESLFEKLPGINDADITNKIALDWAVDIGFNRANKILSETTGKTDRNNFDTSLKIIECLLKYLDVDDSLPKINSTTIFKIVNTNTKKLACEKGRVEGLDEKYRDKVVYEIENCFKEVGIDTNLYTLDEFLQSEFLQSELGKKLALTKDLYWERISQAFDQDTLADKKEIMQQALDKLKLCPLEWIYFVGNDDKFSIEIIKCLKCLAERIALIERGSEYGEAAFYDEYLRRDIQVRKGFLYRHLEQVNTRNEELIKQRQLVQKKIKTIVDDIQQEPISDPDSAIENLVSEIKKLTEANSEFSHSFIGNLLNSFDEIVGFKVDGTILVNTIDVSTIEEKLSSCLGIDDSAKQAWQSYLLFLKEEANKFPVKLSKDLDIGPINFLTEQLDVMLKNEQQASEKTQRYDGRSLLFKQPKMEKTDNTEHLKNVLKLVWRNQPSEAEIKQILKPLFTQYLQSQSEPMPGPSSSNFSP